MNRRPSGLSVAQAARLFGALDVHRRLAVESSYPFMLREREKLLAGSRAQLGKKPPAKPGLRARR